jgi:predicted kinase
MKTLILFRGIPGSGKSTLAQTLCPVHYSADMFFEENGYYEFKAHLLPDAHKWCKEKVEEAMVRDEDIIGVANTFTTEWEMEAYFELAEDYGYRITTIVVENRHLSSSIHNVPEDIIEKMKSRF